MAALGDILREEVTVEIDQIDNEANARAHEVLSRAEQQAAARLEAHQKFMDAEVKAAVRRSQSAAEQTIAIARVQARAEILEQVHRKVQEEFARIREKPDYSALLQSLAWEAFTTMTAAQLLVVHPDDAARMQTWADQQGLALQSDAGLYLGVRLVDRDGNRSVENSLPERLRHAWDDLAGEVAALLWQ